MRCLYAIVSFFVFLSMACAEPVCPSGARVAGECADSNAARITSIEISRPSELALMLDWPVDGIRQGSGEVLLLGAYRTPAGQLRMWGGHGTNVSGDTNVVRADHAFDVAVFETELGTYTDPLDLWIPIGSGELLVVRDAVLHDLELAVETEEIVVPVSGRLLGISDMLERATSAPTFDSDGDGIDDRWIIEAGFEATPAWML